MTIQKHSSRRLRDLAWNLAPVALLFTACEGLPAQSSPDVTVQIFQVMSHMPAVSPGHRIVHAKGLVAQGAFQASKEATSLSRAAHFNGSTVPVTVRFSDSTPDTAIADGSPDASPRGLAIRFLTAGQGTDIVSNSHNGFIVGTGEDFLALQKAIAATDPSKPHPWPIEAFLGSHPRALKFVQDPKPTPVSFANESFYGNNAFTFINKDGKKQIGRYQILPVAGPKYLDDATAKTQPANFLSAELKDRLAKGPVQFRLMVQLAAAGDVTNDGSIIWPDDRKKIELGTISIKSLVPDNDAAERALAFDPTHLIDGIALSDDQLPVIRSRVYAMAAGFRHTAK